jgi:hypothetical protein
VVSTISSNVVLTTLGTIYPDHMDVDLERDVVEMEDIYFGLGMDLGSLSTAIGGDDGEPLPEGDIVCRQSVQRVLNIHIVDVVVVLIIIDDNRFFCKIGHEEGGSVMGLDRFVRE